MRYFASRRRLRGNSDGNGRRHQGGHNRGWSYDGRLGLHKMLQTDIQAGAIHGNGPLATTMRGTVIGD
jgi:hypothetical protein